MTIIKFKDIENTYDAFIIDIWGVVYDGKNPFEEAVEAVNRIIESGKKVVFLSNSPRPSKIAANKLASFGIDMDKASIYTSGDLVREQLVEWNDEIFSNLGRNLYHFGSVVNQDILNGLENINVVDNIEKADFILISMYVDAKEEIIKYDELLQKAIALQLPSICANPDIVAQEGDITRYTSGSFAKRYEELGGKAYYYGKPSSNIFNKVLTSLVDKKVIMIGDTMETDILGANKVGIDSLLLLTGNGQCYSEENYDYHPTFIAKLLD